MEIENKEESESGKSRSKNIPLTPHIRGLFLTSLLIFNEIFYFLLFEFSLPFCCVFCLCPVGANFFCLVCLSVC